MEERETSSDNGTVLPENGKDPNDQTHTHVQPLKPKDVTAEALQASLEQARRMVEAAQKALDTYISIHSDGIGPGNVQGRQNGVGSRELSGEMGGDTRRGVTSRELSGEMGGDTVEV